MADATLPSFIRKIKMDQIITSYCHLHDNRIIVNDRLIFYQENIVKFADLLKSVYKQEQITYPKFYKMDIISKLGFIAAELVLRDNKLEGFLPEEVGVVLSNSSSSLETDIAHNETIRDRSSYFPSPSVFVYTLPNIVIGEVCIRHKIKGENAFLISETYNSNLLFSYVDELFASGRVKACLCGWVEVMGNTSNAMVALVENTGRDLQASVTGFKPLQFNIDNLNLIMTRN